LVYIMTCTWVACKVASPIKVKAMYCMCHNTHVEHLEIQTGQHGITPSSPIPITKQPSGHQLIGQDDVENHIGQHGIKTPPSLIPSTKQLGSHWLIG
jgi:hypothetical protein